MVSISRLCLPGDALLGRVGVIEDEFTVSGGADTPRVANREFSVELSDASVSQSSVNRGFTADRFGVFPKRDAARKASASSLARESLDIFLEVLAAGVFCML